MQRKGIAGTWQQPLPECSRRASTLQAPGGHLRQGKFREMKPQGKEVAAACMPGRTALTGDFPSSPAHRSALSGLLGSVISPLRISLLSQSCRGSLERAPGTSRAERRRRSPWCLGRASQSRNFSCLLFVKPHLRCVGNGLLDGDTCYPQLPLLLAFHWKRRRTREQLAFFFLCLQASSYPQAPGPGVHRNPLPGLTPCTAPQPPQKRLLTPCGH